MSKFASFLAGMGGGYIKAKDKEYERERQAKDDAWREEQQGWQRADRAEKDALRTSMKDAFADRSTIEGTAVTGTTGTNLYKDPAQAQAAADDARIEAEMRGESPSAVATMQATGITGNMSKGHKITTEPVDLASLNSRDAKMARGVNALMAAGDPEKAIGMENTVMENQAKKLGLNVAQLKFSDDQFNRKMQETLSREGDFWGNASQVLTDTSLGGLAGVQVKPVVSVDGKTVQMVGVKDGKEQVMFSAPNTAEGQLAFVQRISKADPATKIGWLKEGVDREAAQAKAALDERRVAAVEQNANTNQRKLDALLMRGAGAGSAPGRGDGTGSVSGAVSGANWSDRNKVIENASKLLPDPSSAMTPEQAATIRAENTKTLGQVDAIFQTNAEFGLALTAPQINQSMVLSKDPKNIITKQDQNTGQVVKMVKVNGRDVIIGIGAGPASSRNTVAASPPPNAAPTAKKPLVYDQNLKMVVDAMATPPKPVATGVGSIDHMRRAFQSNKAIN